MIVPLCGNSHLSLFSISVEHINQFPPPITPLPFSATRIFGELTASAAAINFALSAAQAPPVQAWASDTAPEMRQASFNRACQSWLGTLEFHLFGESSAENKQLRDAYHSISQRPPEPSIAAGCRKSFDRKFLICNAQPKAYAKAACASPVSFRFRSGLYGVRASLRSLPHPSVPFSCPRNMPTEGMTFSTKGPKKGVLPYGT